jgi:hypothetical protein
LFDRLEQQTQRSFIMKFSKLMILPLAFIASTLAFANSVNAPSLPRGVLAQMTVSGGFMAPGAFNTSTVSIDVNGVVTKSTFSGRDFRPGATPLTTIIGKLDNNQLRSLENAIDQIVPGKLVDLDPKGPAGADFPTIEYRVKNRYGTLTVAVRGGDAHTLMLRQNAANYVKNFMDLASVMDRAVRTR